MCKEPRFAVQGLQEDQHYQFRVAAVNQHGTGEFLELENEIVAKLPFGKNFFKDFWKLYMAF